jgi:hypothetical protein
MTCIEAPPRELFHALEILRDIRPEWMHRGTASLETDGELAARAESVKTAFLRLPELGFVDLVPVLVQVVATIRDIRGRHAEVVHELGKTTTAYGASTESATIGQVFFMAARTNPSPLRPALIPREIALRARQLHGQTVTGAQTTPA